MDDPVKTSDAPTPGASDPSPAPPPAPGASTPGDGPGRTAEAPAEPAAPDVWAAADPAAPGDAWPPPSPAGPVQAGDAWPSPSSESPSNAAAATPAGPAAAPSGDAWPAPTGASGSADDDAGPPADDDAGPPADGAPAPAGPPAAEQAFTPVGFEPAGAAASAPAPPAPGPGERSPFAPPDAGDRAGESAPADADARVPGAPAAQRAPEPMFDDGASPFENAPGDRGSATDAGSSTRDALAPWAAIPAEPAGDEAGQPGRPGEASGPGATAGGSADQATAAMQAASAGPEAPPAPGGAPGSSPESPEAPPAPPWAPPAVGAGAAAATLGPHWSSEAPDPSIPDGPPEGTPPEAFRLPAAGPIYRLPEAHARSRALAEGAEAAAAAGAGEATRVDGAPLGAAPGAEATAAFQAAPAPVDDSPWAAPGPRARITPPGGTDHVPGSGDDLAPFPAHGRGDGGEAGDRRKKLLLAGIPILVLVLLLAAWGVDSQLLNSGKVDRNVEVGGESLGGTDEDAVPDALSGLAERVAARPVTILNGDQTYETTAGELGLSLDAEATSETVRAAGGSDPISWAQSFFSTEEIPLQYEISEAVVQQRLTELQGADITAPVEPTIGLGEGDQFVVTPGQAGSGIDGREVAALLPEAAAGDPDAPIEVSADDTEVAPRITDEQAQQLADRANQLTANGLTLRAGQAEARVEPAQLRRWIGQAPPNEDGPVMELAINGEAVTADLPTVFSGLSAEPVNATFDLQSGAPVVVPAQNGVTCCGENSAELVWTALQEGQPEVTLEATVVEPEVTTDEANQLGITAPIGGARAYRSGAEEAGPGPGFTTYHEAGQARVTNIHRMADIVRGTLVPPGEQFSINDVVGQRTTANGFVPAGAIAQGQHVDEVGGGVSQFATTAFNAAYFGGLDIVEYQAHSEWFSRYPPGREATMGYPSPDLVFENNTPYGILVWTSYTDTSLTVTLYSTPWATAEQTGMVETMNGQCRQVTTTRTRTYPDGTSETDTFRATYRPGPNLNCEGQPINPEPPPDPAG